MNMSLQIVENAQFGKVRLQMINEVPWFCGKDVCDVLGFTNSRKAINDHCDEDDVTKCYTVDSKERKNQLTFINESGLYSLIFGSTLPIAKEFKRWVTSEVLPSIRKNGCYLTPAKANEIALGNEIIKAVEDLKENAVTQKTVSLLVADNIAKEQRFNALLQDYNELQEYNQHLYEENQNLQEKANLGEWYLIEVMNMSASTKLIEISDLAKEIKAVGIPLEEMQFLQELRDDGFLKEGTLINIPTKKALDLKLFKITYKNFDDEVKKRTKVSVEGRKWLLDFYKQKYNIK